MRVLLCFCFVILIIDSCITQYQAEDDNSATREKRVVVKRTVRSAVDDLFQQAGMLVENMVITNCKLNGKYEEANNLQNEYHEMKECMGRSKLFLTPKDEYLTYLTECSKESIAKAKDCFADNQSYFPDFMLNATKSMVEFYYDDIDILRGDMRVCLPKMFADDGLTYIQCINDVARDTNDSDIIPPSKEEFCMKYLPSNFCFTNLIKERCDDTANLKKFREDYIAASARPCDTY